MELRVSLRIQTFNKQTKTHTHTNKRAVNGTVREHVSRKCPYQGLL